LIVLGRPEEAAAILRELLPRFEELGDVQYHAMTTSSLGWAAYVQGDAMGAARWAIRGLIENHRMRNAASTTISMQEGIVIAMVLERPDAAALLTGAFEGRRGRYGARPPTRLQRFPDPQDPFAAGHAALGAGDLQGAVTHGRWMSLDEAMALIVELGDSVEVETT
jgi:hypothetical protein